MSNYSRNREEISTSSQTSPRIYSAVLPDGTLIETIFNPDHLSTALLVCKDGTVTKTNSYRDPQTGITYQPAFDDQIRNGSLILPTGIADPGSPQQLLSDVVAHIHKWVDVGPGFERLSARMALLSQVYKRFEHVPYFRVIGLIGTGKSRYLKVLKSICYHPINMGGGATVANLFRSNDKIGTGTLFIDECNFENSGSTSDLAKILNDGYERDGSTTRMNMMKYKQETFVTFSPKFFASNIPFNNDGLESRIFSWTMTETNRKDIPLSLPDARHWQEAENLRNRLLGYRFKYYHAIDPLYDVPELAHCKGRLREIATPLFQATWDTPMSPDESVFLDLYQDDLKNTVQFTEEGAVAGAILACSKAGDRAMFSEIQAMVKHKFQVELTHRRLSDILMTIGVKRTRIGDGRLVHLNSIDLQRLAERYGYSTEQDNEVQQ